MRDDGGGIQPRDWAKRCHCFAGYTPAVPTSSHQVTLSRYFHIACSPARKYTYNTAPSSTELEPGNVLSARLILAFFLG